MTYAPWTHYVAIGDSFTQGVGDPVDGFAKLGAMDLLAAAFRHVIHEEQPESFLMEAEM